ncbi:MAG: hypothetical protein P8X51_11380 [Maritimibacter sp.]
MQADPARYPAWVGELYLEFHRGTFTSVAKVKRNNRRAEADLREIEALASLADTRGAFAYPQERIAKLWDILLLNQFHDILPGSSIGLVYDDSDVNLRPSLLRLTHCGQSWPGLWRGRASYCWPIRWANLAAGWYRSKAMRRLPLMVCPRKRCIAPMAA